ncbi:MAG: winged helix-turn-helix transcriptional regulator [Syntrophomonadaceae bacterium]|nr:winged helix-turn-helix transcriptional regulator [Syntrophomonadaceae bacterium]
MTFNLAFKALSDPNRRQIIKMLQDGDMTAGDIASRFDMTKPSISHHLNVLKQADLVQDVRKGQNIYYSLNTTVFQELIGWFYDLRGVAGESGKNSKPR